MNSRSNFAVRVSENGRPISGAEVFLGKYPGTNKPCDEIDENVPLSPTDGRFVVSPKSETHLSISLLDPPFQTGKITAICIKHPKQSTVIGALLFMFVHEPMSARVQCEMSPQVARIPRGNAQVASPLGQLQSCIATRIVKNDG